MRGVAGVLFVLLLLAGGGCNRSSPADRILSDETLFPSGVRKAADSARSQCPEMTKATQAQARKTGAVVTGSFTLAVPAGKQPKLADIQAKYGAAERVKEGTHYVGDVGFRPVSEGRVSEVVILCAGQ
jgi:hypothetical protein